MLTLVVRDGAERPMTSYAQVGVSVRSWHTGDPVDEAVALDPFICQGRYLRSCRHKMWGKGEAQRIWMAAMKDERRSQYAWRGAPRRSPQSLLTSGSPSPGDATFLTPVLVCPVPEGLVEYLSPGMRGQTHGRRRGPWRSTRPAAWPATPPVPAASTSRAPPRARPSQGRRCTRPRCRRCR